MRDTPALRDAVQGTPPRWPTSFQVAWSPTGLLVTFRCRDDHRWHTLTERDAPLWQEEVVEVFLAPGLDTPASYFELEVNPAGVLFDARIHNPDGLRSTMRADLDWSCAGLRAETSTQEEASGDGIPPGEAPSLSQDWTAHLWIPWAGLDPTSNDSGPTPIWRANFFRVERPDGPRSSDKPDGGADATSNGLDEFSAWSPTRREPANFHVPERFGVLLLEGHPDLKQALEGQDPHQLDVPVLFVPQITVF